MHSSEGAFGAVFLMQEKRWRAGLTSVFLACNLSEDGKHKPRRYKVQILGLEKLYLTRGTGPIAQILYTAQCRWIFVGISRDVATKPHATISIFFPKQMRHAMLWIARGMDRAKQKPVVHIHETSEGQKLVVLFRWTNTHFSSLRELVGEKVSRLYASYVDRPFDIIVPFSVQFRPNDLDLFLEGFIASQRICLSLVEVNDECDSSLNPEEFSVRPFWTTSLGSFTDGYPAILEEFEVVTDG